MGQHPNKAEFEEAITRIGGLHGNMAVLSRLDALLRDYNSDLSDAERLIQSDGPLAATIVKLANSALYGFSSKSEDIPTALQKVGYDQAISLVSMALSKQVFMKDLEAYGISADRYWKHSFFSATFMERQAVILGLDASQAYLLGLLHSIGRVVINELLRLFEIEVYWDRFIPERDWEVAMVGFSNEVAGTLLLDSWDFSKAICSRVANQNKPGPCESDNYLALLDFTRSLAIHLDDEARLAQLCQPGAHAYRKRRKAPAADLLSEIDQVRSHVETVYASLQDC